MEDETGQPFVGRAGQILERLFDAIGLRRQDVYITSILKCRPLKNRNPNPSEIKACTPFLEEQLRIVRPKIIVPLGHYAGTYFFNKYALGKFKISDVHARFFQIRPNKRSLYLVPQYHPAVVLYNVKDFAQLTKDFKVLKRVLDNKHRS